MGAKAPRPGAGKRAAAADEAAKVLTITLQGQEPLRLAVGLIPMQEKMAVRVATGKPYDAFLNPVGEDTIVVWWWLARRANGEPLLPWGVAVSEWPVGLDATDPDQLLVEIDDPSEDADDPEA